MIVYRIAKSRKRATDISGMGAYKHGYHDLVIISSVDELDVDVRLIK
nr:hypothetical protein [Mucilaginibacter sp. FT3.2]